jgi:Icc-related predicted phosphoesterase
LKKGKKVLFIPGNHESFATADFLAEVYGPDAKNIHGYSMKFNDIGIFGAGGTTNIGPAVPITEEEMLRVLRKGSERLKDLDKKIMVTHIHPSGTEMEKMSDIVPASDSVKKAIEELQPDIALCSHVHEASGLEEHIGKTKLINVARKGKIIEI